MRLLNSTQLPVFSRGATGAVTKVIQAIHTAVQGRARYKVNQLYRSESLQKYLEQELSNQPEIKNVYANPLTGNILIIFDATFHHSKIASLIEELVLDGKKWVKDDPSNHRAKKRRKIDKSVANTQEQKVKDWHGMEVNAVLDAFKTSKTLGLSAKAAQAKLKKYGPNVLSETETRSDLSILIDQFTSLPVALLAVAAGVSVATGGLIDALVILGVVAVNGAIGYITESQSERIIHSLKHNDNPSTLAIRNGSPIEINSDDVVVGDILVLKPGNYVVADARLIEAQNLSIDESALTGESIPVTKTTSTLTGQNIPLGDRTNMAYKGTLVTGGQGLAVVVATGKYTEMGQIQRLVGEATATETPLSRQLDEVGSQLVLLCSAVCGVVFGVGLLRGYGLVEMLKTSISLAVAAVPEGLPTIATTTLALGIQEMRRHNVLVRSLSAVEALGSVQTICMDKTGTITENRMSVKEIHAGIGDIQVNNDEFVLNDKSLNPYECDALLKMIHIAVLCNESEVNRRENGEYTVNGSSTENALIQMAITAGVNIPDLREKFPLQATKQRSENRNIMSTLHTTHDNQILVAVKGSPTEVLDLCSRRRTNGKVISLSEKDRRALEIDNDRMAGKALRVLAVAYNYVDDTDADTNPEENLIWLGLIGMADPIRTGVKQLIGQFHEAGIDTVMITGDQSPTAYAIGKELQLSRHQHLEILDSTDLSALHPEAMQALCDKVDVFARVSPASKLQIVQSLQGAGRVVAMTGDGINDAPALKTANVGVAMGHSGTDVAREVADIILEDDRIETMIIAVSRGRTIYNNIRKSVHFLLATNLSEIAVTLVATAAGLGEPLTAIQLLWLNLVTDIFPGLALALEAPEPDVLSQPPRNPDEPIIQSSDFARIGFESATLSLSTLAAYGYGILNYGIGPQASTIAFLSLTSGQLLHSLSCRSQHHTIFEMGQGQLPPNHYLTLALGGSFALQLVAMAVPGLRTLLQITPLGAIDAAVIGGSALLPLVVNETTKKLRQGESHEKGLHVHV
jgi:Ca2+-transporting ATPase